MAIYAKMAMRPNTFGMPFPLFYFSWIFLLRLNSEIRRFAYYRINHEDCEGMSCSSILGEYRVATFRLISVDHFELLEWLNWWIRPRIWDPSPVEGIVVSDLASIPCTDTGSSGIIPWRQVLGTCSSKYSCQSYLGMCMPEDSLIWHSFNFLGMCPSSCDTKWRECVVKDHMVLGRNMPSSGV